jgi:hypothetical protein
MLELASLERCVSREPDVAGGRRINKDAPTIETQMFRELQEYRENAAECRRMAGLVVAPRDQRTWMELAEYWTAKVKKLEREQPGGAAK